MTHPPLSMPPPKLAASRVDRNCWQTGYHTSGQQEHPSPWIYNWPFLHQQLYSPQLSISVWSSQLDRLISELAAVILNHRCRYEVVWCENNFFLCVCVCVCVCGLNQICRNRHEHFYLWWLYDICANASPFSVSWYLTRLSVSTKPLLVRCNSTIAI